MATIIIKCDMMLTPTDRKAITEDIKQGIESGVLLLPYHVELQCVICDQGETIVAGEGFTCTSTLTDCIMREG